MFEKQIANFLSQSCSLLWCSFGAGRPQNKHKIAKDWSRAAYPPQRSLRAALGCCPTTAGGAQFCLLCCQPGPVPESLPARPPPLTQGRPCRPPVWLGHPIHTASRTCHGPQRFISQVPMRGTGRHDPPQQNVSGGKTNRTLHHKCARDKQKLKCKTKTKPINTTEIQK